MRQKKVAWMGHEISGVGKFRKDPQVWGKGVRDEFFSWGFDAGGGGDCAVEGMGNPYGAVCVDGVWVGSGGAGAGGVASETRD